MRLASNPLPQSPRRLLRTLLASSLFVTTLLPTLCGAQAFDKWNPKYRLKSAYWRAYASDQDTLGLFHLDKAKGVIDKELEAEMAGMEDAEEPADAAPEAALLTAEGGGESRGGNVLDSGPQKLNAQTAGTAAWSKQGRFGGALQLPGGGSALVTAAYPDIKRGKSGTIECWLCPEKARAPHATIFSLDDARLKRSALELRYAPDGTLTVVCYNRVVGASESILPPGEWNHLALAWARDRQIEMSILINSEVRAAFEHKLLPIAFENLAGSVRVGNDCAGAAGLTGLVDEVRVSAMRREYYSWDMAWTDPDGTRPIVDSQPYLRDSGDLLFAASFDETVEPLRAGDGTAVELHPKPDENNPTAKQKQPEYHEGIRGQAVMVGTGKATPLYPARGNFNPERGSFELWVTPWDWDNHKVQGFHDPMEHVPIFRVVNTAKQQHGRPQDILTFGFLHKKPLDKRPPPPVEPGHWFHVVGTYDKGTTRLYLNGRPMPDAVCYSQAAKPSRDETPPPNYLILLDPVNPRVNYHGEHSLIDELRVYSRPLTPPEVANAHERYRPKPNLQPLPFAHVEMAMNYPLAWLHSSLELLGPKRDAVASATLRAFGPQGDEPIAEGQITKIVNGRGAVRISPAEVGYGKHRVDLRFLDKAGNQVEHMEVEHQRERPPWLGSTVGIHDEVLPGWEPMTVDGRSVRFWGRELVIRGSGIPEKIVSQGQNMLAQPIRVKATAGGNPIPWKPSSQSPRIDKATDLVVVTTGSMEGGGWQLDTRITTEYDGLMKVEAALSGKLPTEIDSFRVEIPLNASNALLMGYWTGARNFRAATWHGVLPQKEGVLFASNKPKRARNKDVRGSFVPHIFLGDDERGLVWFAENDRGWNKSNDVPALEVVRKGEVVTLRLNIIHQKTTIKEPRTFVFGLHPTPVKALPKDWRTSGRILNFGWCDSFSRQALKTAGNYGSFNIYPEEYDWEAAKARSENHRVEYGRDFGYFGPFLYIDRNWVGLPPSASEFGGIWYKSGYYRYLPEAANCYLWNLDQWMKRKLIVGVYIDDAWIGTFRDPETGPAYRMEDGKVQPGFEFFDYHEFMKRLRWVFLDNGLRPTIWVHMTHTLFTPCLSFAEYLLDGEDRFPAWGVKWDFMDAWPAGRIRYNNGRKWGLVPIWFIKIGADLQPATPMPHWQYRQSRAYVAATAGSDIMAIGVPRDVFNEVYVDEARCVAYWSRDCPAKCERPGVQPSFWIRPDRTIGMIVNRSKVLLEEVTLVLDPEKLGFAGAKPEEIIVTDIDKYDPPKGEDYSKIETPKAPADEEEDEDEFFAELEERDEQEQIKASGVVPLDDHNFRWKHGKLTLRIRAHDYRLLSFTKRKN